MKNKYISKILILIVSCFFLVVNLSAQDEEEEINYKSVVKLSYLKNTDGQKILTAKISARVDRKWRIIENAELKFFAGTDSLIELGTVNSDATGTAVLKIDDSIQLPVDTSGACTYSVEYEGTENSRAKSSDLTVVDIQMEMSLEEIDSVKTITVKAYKVGSDGEHIPIVDENVMIYVKRLYSDLKIGEVYLEEEAEEGSLAFRDIPGDSIGNIELIARFDDHEDYGYVEKRQIIAWGTPVSYKIKDTPHEIWTNVAPTWMTITVVIFVLGVWYHLMLVFIRMWKIKKQGKSMS
jgi:hypothetical protein